MHIDQRHHDKEPASTAEKAFVIIISLAFLFMMTMEIITNYEPKKLGALFFVISWVPLLFIHEFGHAIAAIALGWRAQRIVIGVGKVMAKLRVFNTPMEIRSIPLEGFVQIAPKTVEWARYKHAFIYFAGPGIELLLFYLILKYFGGWEQLTTINDNYAQIALQSFAFAALAGAILNLIPLGIITRDGTTPNDGMGILQCLFATKMDYEMWIREAKNEKQE